MELPKSKSPRNLFGLWRDGAPENNNNNAYYSHPQNSSFAAVYRLGFIVLVSLENLMTIVFLDILTADRVYH